MMKIEHKTTPKYHLNLGHTPQFKTVKIQITFNNDLAYDTVSCRALLPYIMKATTLHFPTRKDMQTHLEELYNASFNAGVKKIGLSQELIFDLTIIDNSYSLENEDILKQGFEFLNEIFFHPRFDEKIFVEEKRLLEEYFYSIYDNKMRYSIIKLNDYMYENDPYALQPLGTLEALETLTLADIKQAYKSMIESDFININVVGNVTQSQVTSLIDQYLPFTTRHKENKLLDKSTKPIKDVQHYTEIQDVQQGKFVLGYQFPVYYTTEKYYQAIVFNTLLGGNPESLLFKRIREEMNKVYFIGSSYDQYKGSLVIYGGIDAAEYDLVVAEINTIIQTMVDGKIHSNRLDIAKKVLINSLIESFDSPASLSSRINHLSLFNKTFNPDELIRKVQAVTEEDMIEMATKLTLDTTFFLRGETS